MTAISNPIMSKNDILELLNTTREETLKFFDLPDADLNKTYGKDKWNIRQILHHLTDSELIFLERLKRIIAEPKQVIWAYDQDQWNEAFHYKTVPLTHKKQLYQICRQLNHELVETYYDMLPDKEFVHSNTGLWTLKTEFERVPLHNLTHNRQMQAALTTTA